MENRFEIFTTQIAKINRCIKKIKTEETIKHNLKSTHVSCLYYLYKQGGPLTAKELCDICDEDKAAISRALEYLEKNDYIVCSSKYQKRYKSPLCLTEIGKSIGKTIESTINKILSTVSKELTKNELEIFYKGLNLITNNLQEYCNKY